MNCIDIVSMSVLYIIIDTVSRWFSKKIEIYDKRLFFLIPFYAIRYEKYFDFDRLDEAADYDKIRDELKKWSDRLINAYENGTITEDEGIKLKELSQLILKHITRKLNSELAKGMVNTMGGKVLELPSDIHDAEVRREGADMLAALLKLLTPGSVEFDNALNATEDERQELYVKYNISQ